MLNEHGNMESGYDRRMIRIRVRGRKEKVGDVDSRGFTLIELLVVMSVTSVLMAILVPALGKVRRQARSIKGMNNQQQITSALSLFASDNDERYPESVATVGFDGPGSTWNWSDPTQLIGNRSRLSAFSGSFTTPQAARAAATKAMLPIVL